MFKNTLKVSPEGFAIIFLSAAFGWILSLFGLTVVSVLFFIVTASLVFFFRDPEREIEEVSDGVLSPADGKVVEIENVEEKDFLDEQRLRISIFLSILDCHINRFPVSGKVLATKYTPGNYELAFKPGASDRNERLSTYIESDNGIKMVLVQIAGFLARRIISKASVGKHFNQGERFGIIKFGSRTDIYLPPESLLNVKPGDKVRAGETILAWLKRKED